MLPNPLQDSLSKIRNNMIEISGIARANGGLLISIPGRINSEIQAEEAFIEPGSEMATFALSWQSPKDVLVLELVSPDGEIITVPSASGKIRPIYSDRPYMGFQIEQPVSGTWKLIVKPERVSEIADFHLFVFSQNPRIGGGIISPWRFYKPGDVIPLQFQGYFDRPITRLKVNGIVTPPGGKGVVTIAFSDDEKKDPRAGVPGNGLYSGSLQDTFTPGMYTIRLIVESDGKTTTYAKPDVPPGEERKYDYDPIPAFRREYMITLAVGEEPVRRVDVEPNSGYPGQKIQATVKGSLTHFKQGYTSLDFGDGISVSDIQIVDDLTVSATLNIDKTATLGIRSIIASTDIYKEIVKLEEGFQVVRGTPNRRKQWAAQLSICAITLFMSLLLLIVLLLGRRKVGLDRWDSL